MGTDNEAIFMSEDTKYVTAASACNEGCVRGGTSSRRGFIDVITGSSLEHTHNPSAGDTCEAESQAGQTGLKDPSGGYCTVACFSDLHLEFNDTFVPQDMEDVDVVVVAGDAHPGITTPSRLARLWPNHPVIYVPGNHDYYGQNFHGHTRHLREKAPENIHVLQRSSCVIHGVRFLGATLWTDMAGRTPSECEEIRKEMNDYRRIRVEPSYRTAP